MMVMQDSIYDQLLHLPIFQGLSANELTGLLEKVKMDFRRYPAGKVMIHEGEACEDIRFLMNGRIKATQYSSNRRLQFHEWISAPAVVGIDNLFGLTQTYERTFECTEDSRLLVVERMSVINGFFTFDICRFNFLNALSAKLYRTNQRLHEKPETNLAKRFVHLVCSHVANPVGTIEVDGKMTDLAEYLMATRLKVSNMLNELEALGLVQLGRCHIKINALQELISYSRGLKNS